MVKALARLLVVLPLLAPVAAAAAGHQCQCLYRGQRFDQGALVCIKVDGTDRMARCDMALNNSSWTFLRSGCPTASHVPVPPAVLAASLRLQ